MTYKLQYVGTQPRVPQGACACEEVNVSVLVSVCNHVVGGCVSNALMLMYVFTVLFCAFLIVMTVLVLF